MAKLDNYPLPRIEDLFTKLSGGMKFSKLDLRHAYNQIPPNEEYMTVSTMQGLFEYNCLPFGDALHLPFFKM